MAWVLPLALLLLGLVLGLLFGRFVWAGAGKQGPPPAPLPDPQEPDWTPAKSVARVAAIVARASAGLCALPTPSEDGPVDDDRARRVFADELLARLVLELLRLLKAGRVPRDDRARITDLLAEARRLAKPGR